MRLALKKSMKHKRKIAQIHKRFPVFNLLNAEQEQPNAIGGSKQRDNTQEIAARYGVVRRDANYGEMVSFLDEIDQKFNLDEVEEEKLQEIKDFIKERARLAGGNELMASDGELTREIAHMLHNRITSRAQSMDDQAREQKELLDDIETIKLAYKVDELPAS